MARRFTDKARVADTLHVYSIVMRDALKLYAGSGEDETVAYLRKLAQATADLDYRFAVNQVLNVFSETIRRSSSWEG